MTIQRPPKIAGELSVSANTVSTHVRSIYAGLHIRDRSSPVQRARELGLLAVGPLRLPSGHRIPVMRGAGPAHRRPAGIRPRAWLTQLSVLLLSVTSPITAACIRERARRSRSRQFYTVAPARGGYG